MNFQSKLLEEAIASLATLPSIGRKSALRLTLHLLNEDPAKSHRIANALVRLRDEIKYCSECYSFSDHDKCHICVSTLRDSSVLCVVENIRDLLAIEETGQYQGKYHVLGGVISPIDGIGPDDLQINSLIERIKNDKIQELIMAVSPTIEGETTIYYLSKKLNDWPGKISTIARGVSFGGELEYADELTLGRSILARVTYTAS